MNKVSVSMFEWEGVKFWTLGSYNILGGERRRTPFTKRFLGVNFRSKDLNFFFKYPYIVHPWIRIPSNVTVMYLRPEIFTVIHIHCDV